MTNSLLDTSSASVVIVIVTSLHRSSHGFIGHSRSDPYTATWWRSNRLVESSKSAYLILCCSKGKCSCAAVERGSWSSGRRSERLRMSAGAQQLNCFRCCSWRDRRRKEGRNSFKAWRDFRGRKEPLDRICLAPKFHVSAGIDGRQEGPRHDDEKTSCAAFGTVRQEPTMRGRRFFPELENNQFLELQC